jgi:hypothetical protein
VDHFREGLALIVALYLIGTIINLEVAVAAVVLSISEATHVRLLSLMRTPCGSLLSQD